GGGGGDRSHLDRQQRPACEQPGRCQTATCPAHDLQDGDHGSYSAAISAATPPSDFMRSILRRVDIGRLLLALLLALALYSAVRAEQNPPESGTFEVPVDVSNIPPGLLIIGGETSTV